MTSPTALTQHAEMEFRMLSELRQPRSWERDVTGGRWREVENKAECHSLTGVLTIIGCHHFLIRPVSKKCSNKTAVQGWPPSLLYSHTHTHTPMFRDALLMCTHVTRRCTNRSNVSEKCHVQTLRGCVILSFLP